MILPILVICGNGGSGDLRAFQNSVIGVAVFTPFDALYRTCSVVLVLSDV